MRASPLGQVLQLSGIELDLVHMFLDGFGHRLVAADESRMFSHPALGPMDPLSLTDSGQQIGAERGEDPDGLPPASMSEKGGKNGDG